MSATTPRSSTALNVLPPTQNTAPVLEYRCLYTSDLRRKQKRWQDGRLKFHTFNKRIMVFDDRGNVVGDTHWRQDYNFDEGEELELERSGKLVQVTEYEGRRDHDLSELFDKRLKEREERVAAKTSRSFQGLTGSSSTLSNQIKDTVDRMPKQPVPPADQLQYRPSKRRKPNSDIPPCKSGYAQGLTGATLALSGKLTSSSLQAGPLWARTSRSHEHFEAIDRTSEHTIQMTRPRARANVEAQPSLPVRDTYSRCMNGAPLILGWRPSVSISVVNGTATGAIGHGDILCEAPEDKLNGRIYKRGLGRVKDSTKDSTNSLRLGVRTPTRSPISIISLDVISENEAKPRTRPSPVDSQKIKARERFRFLERSKPLRIKSRPKKKLLCMENSQPNSLASAVSEIKRSEASTIQLQNEPREQLVASSEIPQQLPILCKLAYLSEDSPSHRRDGTWSSVVDTGTDYRTMDTNLSCKGPRISPKENPGNIEAEVQIPVGVNKLVTVLNLERSNSFTETALVETMSLRLGNTSNDKLQNGFCVVGAVDKGRTDNIQKDGTTKLENPGTLQMRMVHKIDATGTRKVSGNALVQAHTPSLETPYMNNNDVAGKPCSELSSTGERDKGPWSREAFDLFDWKPNNNAAPSAPSS